MPPTSIDGTDITGATIDGTDVTEITVDGDTVFSADRTPSSVVHQYLEPNFTTSTWIDSVGNGDMSVSGLNSSTFNNGDPSVFSPGSGQFGLANGPQNLPEKQTFGVGFTVEGTDNTGPTRWFGSRDSGGQFVVNDSDFFDGSNGELLVQFTDANNNNLTVETNQQIMDGVRHTVIINKNGNSANDIDIYFDDMTTPVSFVIRANDAFDHTNYLNNQDMAFFALNNIGNNTGFKSYDTNVFEFNEQPYTQSERGTFKSEFGI